MLNQTPDQPYRWMPPSGKPLWALSLSDRLRESRHDWADRPYRYVVRFTVSNEYTRYLQRLRPSSPDGRPRGGRNDGGDPHRLLASQNPPLANPAHQNSASLTACCESAVLLACGWAEMSQKHADLRSVRLARRLRTPLLQRLLPVFFDVLYRLIPASSALFVVLVIGERRSPLCLPRERFKILMTGQ
jgi:hypothetical protein